ncbi:MAG: hypothetical protein AAFQ94_29835 [Bacteroidota bacterium]
MQKVLLILSIGIFSILSGCGYFLGTTETEEISDLSKKWKKTIKADLSDDEFVHQARLRVAGTIEGKCSINGHELGPGKVNEILYNGDHYSKEYEVRYQPVGEVRGKLKVYVTFHY